MKKLLRAILAELIYIRKCRVAELKAAEITPPPGEPDEEEPDGGN